MNALSRILNHRAAILIQVVLICVVSLILTARIAMADPADQPQAPQGRGVVKDDGQVEWKFGDGKSAEETQQQIPNQEDAPPFTPEQEKEMQEILDEVYSNPELKNVRKMFDEWAEQDRLEREGLLPKKEPKKLSALDEAWLRGQVMVDGWIKFWRQFVPASIFPFPKEKDPALEQDPWDNPQPDLPPKPAEDTPPAPSGDSKDPANNPRYSPDPPDTGEPDWDLRGSKGLFESFNGFWWDGNKGMPPTPGDTWNFLPEYKPGESVYENMPEMEEVKIDGDAMPIADPEPLQEIEGPAEPTQGLINGSMPFDPGFGGSFGGVNEEPEEDFLEGLEMAMDSYGHVSVKINGQFVPINQVTKEQAQAERARQEARQANQPITTDDAARSGLETETDSHGNTFVKINGESVNIKDVTKGKLKGEQNRLEAVKSGLETETDQHGNTSVKINGQSVPIQQVTKEQLKAERERLEKQKAGQDKTKSQSRANQAPQSTVDQFGEADSLNQGTASGSFGRGTPDAQGIQFNRDLPTHEDSASEPEFD